VAFTEHRIEPLVVLLAIDPGPCGLWKGSACGHPFARHACRLCVSPVSYHRGVYRRDSDLCPCPELCLFPRHGPCRRRTEI